MGNHSSSSLVELATACQHWHLTIEDHGIAWLGLDKADASTNVLSREVLTEFSDIVDALARDVPTGLVLFSSKPSGFIAGADINEFPLMTSEAAAYELIKLGHENLARFTALPCTKVAMINGMALGGGLELALACDARVVAASNRSTLGLPEVQLGIHPGFGGTVRATRLIGVSQAMSMMLTGKPIRPAKAKAIGLVDKVVPESELRSNAQSMATAPAPQRRTSFLDRLVHIGAFRRFLANRLRANVRQHARQAHYPAPFAIVDLWEKHPDSSPAAYDAEARSFAKLVDTATSRNLVRVYFLQQSLKHTATDSVSDESDPPAEGVGVHVVGAGVMGGDIAAWCAAKGFNVTLQDREMKFVTPALDRAAAFFDKRFKDPQENAAARSRLNADIEGSGVPSAAIIIEAIFEDRDAKQALYQQIEPRMRDDAILATNTSSIPLEELATGLQRPDRMVGLHFFNPVAKLPLVEVVNATQSSDAAVATGLNFARDIGKLPLPCKSAPGFLVNRILAPYMAEALELIREGKPLAEIDHAAVEFGMPMGPVELIDSVGIDVALHVAEILGPVVGRPVAPELAEMVAAGRLGRKTGHGFYQYDNKKPVRPALTEGETDPDVQERLILSLLNEAVTCLAEGVVDNADFVDAGVIFGTGFAPFRGGPMHYARTCGIDQVISRLEALASQYGTRFTPSSGWAELRQ